MDQLSQGITITIIATLFLVLVAVGIIVLILLYQKKQIHYQKEKERQLMESKLETQESTLKKVSQDIHDNIGQVLTLAKLNINTLNLDNVQELKEKLSDTNILLTQAIGDLRNLAKSLNTDFITDIGLLESIEYELKIINKIVKCTIRMDIDGVPQKLHASQELILFRIFQEALNNIIKHANATNVLINFHYQSTEVIMQISDDGDGFDLKSFYNSTARSSGLGIYNIQNRARQIGANLIIDSAMGKGTTIKLRLPISKFT